MKKYVDGVLVDLTDKEIEEFNQRLNSLPSSYETAIKNLRFKRTKLLQETDWMANSDVTMSDDWKTYRQQLRDLPSGLDTLEKVEEKNFPTKPSE
tara:strand:+ start:48 stop:332 length:285 start_codon:yes stop_codon:yes gene_type:complete